jgi:molybdopterin synthase catalytic subunit
MILVTDQDLDPARMLAAFSLEQANAGAIVSFVGQVRGGDVQALELNYHPFFTAKVVKEIAEDAMARFGIADCCIVHRHGRLLPGEPIVFVAAAAEHRRAAFDAVDYLMDRLKLEAPFWKREERADGARWIEARPSDVADHQRWATGHVR